MAKRDPVVMARVRSCGMIRFIFRFPMEMCYDEVVPMRILYMYSSVKRFQPQLMLELKNWWLLQLLWDDSFAKFK